VCSDIYQHALPSEDLNALREILIRPLEALLLKGSDRPTQQTASVCLVYLIDSLKNRGKGHVIKAEVLRIFLRLSFDLPFLYSAVRKTFEAEPDLIIDQEVLQVVQKVLWKLRSKITGQSNQNCYLVSPCF